MVDTTDEMSKELREYRAKLMKKICPFVVGECMQDKCMYYRIKIASGDGCIILDYFTYLK